MTTLKRSPAAPNVPTVSEALGIADYEVDSWYAVFAPAKTPRAMIERMRQEIVKVVQTSEMKEKLLQQGANAVGGTPEELDRIVKAELIKWRALVRHVAFQEVQRVGAGFVNEINSRRPVDAECCSNPLRLDAHPFCEPLVLHRHDAWPQHVFAREGIQRIVRDADVERCAASPSRMPIVISAPRM